MTVEPAAVTRATQEYVDRPVAEVPLLTAEQHTRLTELLHPVRLTAAQSPAADMRARHAHGCARCTNRWDGLRTAHCSACHETFTTPGVFDKHRRDSNCLQPHAAGLVLTTRAYRCWATPSRPGMVWQSKSERLLVSPKVNGPRAG
jgi:hypothetical protein